MSRDLPPGRRGPETNPGAKDDKAANASKTADTGEEGQDDPSGLPPFVSTWGGFYRLVLFTFLGLVLLFYAIQAAFR